MLVMTPQARRMMRKERNRERDARRGKVGRGRFEALANDLGRIILLAFQTGQIASIFGLEGPLRAGLRADLCRQGWGWLAADLTARDLLSEIFTRIGAKRPDWYEGQPEWTIEAGTLIERTRCVRCQAPLPEGHYKFCSRMCSASHAAFMHRKRQASEDLAVHLAVTKD